MDTEKNIILTTLIEWSPKIVAALIVLFVFWLIYIFTKRVFYKAMMFSGIDETLVNVLIKNVYGYILGAFAVVMAASQLGINVIAAVTGLGVAGIAIGFAAKDSLSNMIAGIFILLDKPFSLGQSITVADCRGQVIDITLRTTRLKTISGNLLVIPNQKIINEMIINHELQQKVFVATSFIVEADTDIDFVRTVLVTAASNVDGILERDPRVSVQSLKNGGIEIQVAVWIPSDASAVLSRYELVELSKKALDENNVRLLTSVMNKEHS